MSLAGAVSTPFIPVSDRVLVAAACEAGRVAIVSTPLIPVSDRVLVMPLVGRPALQPTKPGPRRRKGTVGHAGDG